MKELLILIVVLLILSPNLFWKTYHGPVHYEHKKIESLQDIPLYSIIFVEWDAVILDKISIGMVDHAGLPIVFPLYDEEILKYDNKIILVISNSKEILQRVTSGDVNVLPPNFPVEKVNSFHIPVVKTFSVKMMNVQLEEIQNQFSYRVYSWHMHDSNHERANVGYPNMQNLHQPVWTAVKPLLVENHMHPNEYKGIYLPVLFKSENVKYFHDIETFSSLWPGSTIFLSRFHPTKVIFAYHPHVSIKTDGTIQPISFPVTDWIHMDLQGNWTRVAYYRLRVSSLPVFVP